MRKRIDVTEAIMQESIERRKSGGYLSRTCPVALAIKTLVQPDLLVAVGINEYQIVDTDVPLSKRLQRWIYTWDIAQHRSKPAAFYVEIPDEYLALPHQTVG